MATMSDGRRAPQASGRALLQRRVTMPPTPQSAGRARRAVRDLLVASGRHQWLDDAALAVSEVVTNAVLHAHTDIEVVIEVFAESVWVEVRDFDETLPVQRDYGKEGTTGRGMRLLRELTPRCGVQSLGEAGKVVWFCVSDEKGQASPDDLAAAWADVEVEGGDRRPTRQIVLASMPATLWLSAPSTTTR
jgi:anti-sigma regulatory factor (Ser/Thr protein kinase)